jgi:hypothetical protein
MVDSYLSIVIAIFITINILIDIILLFINNKMRSNFRYFEKENIELRNKIHVINLTNSFLKDSMSDLQEKNKFKDNQLLNVKSENIELRNKVVEYKKKNEAFYKTLKDMKDS